VVGLGTYSREFARDVREAPPSYGLEALITDDYLEVEAKVAELQPELVLGTQMERHIAKRLGVPCAVISAPVHVQDFPARYSPQMGFEGANVHVRHLGAPADDGPGGAPAPHVPRGLRVPRRRRRLAPGRAGAGATAAAQAGRRAASAAAPWRPRAGRAAPKPLRPHRRAPAPPPGRPAWAPDAEKELQKIPFFVRGKARRNTERYAARRGLATITVETLYDAKAHFSR
jgi:light-independent protochlorophyllide reductase subunit B